MTCYNNSFCGSGGPLPPIPPTEFICVFVVDVAVDSRGREPNSSRLACNARKVTKTRTAVSTWRLIKREGVLLPDAVEKLAEIIDGLPRGDCADAA